jgi:hypothetical protein
MITPEQLEEFLYLPEPRRRLNEIVSDLCDGISIICTLPVPIKQDVFYLVIAEECRKIGVECKIFAYDASELLPENYIAQCCGVRLSPGEQVSIEQIFEEGGIADVTIITLSELSSDMVRHWTRMLRQWSAYARTYQARTKQCPRALMVVINQAELSRSVKDDVYLKRYYFWGWISTVELLLVARSIAWELGLTLEESLWVESVFVELAGTDPELLFWLLDRCRVTDISSARDLITRDITGDVITRDQMNEQLLAFCEEKGWAEEQVSAGLDTGGNNNEFAQNRPLTPPSDLDPLWCAGMANWNDNDGVFIHSATLALQGDTATLEHRIWRGQARVLLPLLDRVRQEICDYLNRNFKQKWVSFCEANRNPNLPGDASCQNGVAEYSVIVDFFRLNESKSKVLKQLRRPVDYLRLARNNLAHYEPLGWLQFSQMISEIKKVESLVTVTN